jgi:hypothetical protein
MPDKKLRLLVGAAVAICIVFVGLVLFGIWWLATNVQVIQVLHDK